MTVGARGFFEQLLFIKENTYAVKPTITPGDMVQLPYNSLSIGSNENLIDPETITYGSRAEVEFARGNISVEGSATVPIDTTYIGYWFQLFFGDPTTTGSGPYTHVFEPPTSTPSATLQAGHTDLSPQVFKHYTGVKINRMAMRFVVDTELTADIDFIGSAEIVDALNDDAAPSTETFTRFNAKDILFKEGGVTVASCTECSIEFNNNIEDVYTLSNNGFRAEAPGQVAVIVRQADVDSARAVLRDVQEDEA